jgi:hypothetical protein
VTALAEAAVAYALNGWPVFPIKAWHKTPPLTRHGSKDATADRIAVARMWEAYPDANIGVATGGGIAVIDVDPRSGGVRDPAWPGTLTARTPSGGLHLYYGVDFEVRNSASALAPGVDVRGVGGYVVGPPSVTLEGRYKWVHICPMAKAPESLFRVPGRGPNLSSGYDPPEVVSEGGRNDAVVRYAGWLAAQGWNAADLEEDVLDFNEGACRPPLPYDEVIGIIRRAEAWLL